MASLSYTFCIGFRWVTIVRSARTLAAGDVTLPRCVCPACIALTVADYALIFTKHKNTVLLLAASIFVPSRLTDNQMSDSNNTTSCAMVYIQLVYRFAFRKSLMIHRRFDEIFSAIMKQLRSSLLNH